MARDIRYCCGLALGNLEMRVAVIRRGEGESLTRAVEVVASESGRRSTASTIALASSGEWLVGDGAESQFAKNAKGTLSQVLCLVPREDDDLEGEALRLRCVAAKQKVQVVSAEEAKKLLCFEAEGGGGGELTESTEDTSRLEASKKGISQTKKKQQRGSNNDSSKDTEWPCVLLAPCEGLHRILTVEMALRMILNKLRQLVEDFCASGIGSTVSADTCAVLSLPAEVAKSTVARRVITAAATTIGLHILQIVSDSSAVLMSHGLDQKKEHASLCLVDIGGSAARCQCFGLHAGVVRPLTQEYSSPEVSCSALTSKLETFCTNQILRRQKVDVNDGGEKARRRLRLACVAAAKILATNKPGQADVEAEALVDGIDCRVRVTKARYDDMCADVYRGLQATIEAMLDEVLSKQQHHHDDKDPLRLRLICFGAGAKNEAIITSAKRGLSAKNLLAENEHTTISRRLDPEDATVLGAAKHAGLIVFGLDPSRDTPATLQKIGKKKAAFRLSSPRLDAMHALGLDLSYTTQALELACLPSTDSSIPDADSIRKLLQHHQSYTTIAPRLVPLPYQVDIDQLDTSAGSLLVVCSVDTNNNLRLPLAACRLPETNLAAKNGKQKEKAAFSIVASIDSQAKLTILHPASKTILIECPPPPAPQIQQ